MIHKPRVLVLTLSFGSGHVTAARNLAAEFRRQLPDADLHLVDVLAECSAWFRVFYAWTYWALIRHTPWLWRKFFDLRVRNRAERTAPVWAWRWGCRKVFDEIERFQPELIFAVEVAASEIAVIAHRSKISTASIVNVITDFETEPTWVNDEIAMYFVANEVVNCQLVSWGANRQNIKTYGIPIGDSFARKYDVEDTRRQFDLDERPVVLMMGGGMGPTRMVDVAARLLASDAPLQIVALPGKDHVARSALQKLSSTKMVSLKILEWTDSVAQLMQVSRLLATKPGGLTLSEASASGLPLVLFDSIPGPEETNAKYFVAAGGAVLTREPKETASEILRLLRDEGLCRQMSLKIANVSQADATRRIVEWARLKAFCIAADRRSSVVATRKPLLNHLPLIDRRVKTAAEVGDPLDAVLSTDGPVGEIGGNVTEVEIG